MTNDPMRAVQQILQQLRELCPCKHTMRWTGTKIPRGSTIGDVAVGWTQHGQITGVDGEHLGYYERTKEFGGPGQDEHEMLISTKEPIEVVAPDGSVCDPH